MLWSRRLGVKRWTRPRVTHSQRTLRHMSAAMPSRKERRRMEDDSHKRVSAKLVEGKTGLWEIVVGLEVHAQIITNSKLFSGT